jgi:hypothetical protein
VVAADIARSASLNTDMSTEPDEIRARIAALLADLPNVEGSDVAHLDIDGVAARLEEAHDLLVHALEAVEKGPATEHGPVPESSEMPDG